jgi:tRNA uracil 4-sulfurtransferase
LILLDVVIVRFGEIWIKSNYVRRKFKNILKRNIKNQLKYNSLNFDITADEQKIMVKTDQANKVVSVLKTVFGIKNISVAKHCRADIDDISKLALSVLNGVLSKGKTFAVRVKRFGNNEYSSMELASKVGFDIGDFYKNKVDLSNPDVILYVQVRFNDAYVYTSVIEGVGGLPVSCEGNVYCDVFSVEDLVACLFVMKRGCKMFVKTNEEYLDILKRYDCNIMVMDKSLTMDDIIKKYEIKAIVKSDFKFEDLKSKYKVAVFRPIVAFSKGEINKIYKRFIL